MLVTVFGATNASILDITHMGKLNKKSRAGDSSRGKTHNQNEALFPQRYLVVGSNRFFGHLTGCFLRARTAAEAAERGRKHLNPQDEYLFTCNLSPEIIQAAAQLSDDAEGDQVKTLVFLNPASFVKA